HKGKDPTSEEPLLHLRAMAQFAGLHENVVVASGKCAPYRALWDSPEGLLQLTEPEPRNVVVLNMGNNRRRNRTKAVLPVRVSGMDTSGNSYSDLVHTLDITHTGARLGAIHRR